MLGGIEEHELVRLGRSGDDRPGVTTETRTGPATS